MHAEFYFDKETNKITNNLLWLGFRIALNVAMELYRVVYVYEIIKRLSH